MKNNNLNTIAIVQARLGSTRLPGKVLLEIESKPVLLHIVNRLKRVLKVDDIIIATSSLKINSKIISFCFCLTSLAHATHQKKKIHHSSIKIYIVYILYRYMFCLI